MGVVHINTMTNGVQRMHDLCHQRITQIRHVLLEGEAKHKNIGFGAGQSSSDLPGHEICHAVIHIASGEDHFRRVAGFACTVSEILRIDADAMPANKSRGEIEEVPFRTSGF